jgi:hypothetical protein
MVALSPDFWGYQALCVFIFSALSPSISFGVLQPNELWRCSFYSSLCSSTSLFASFVAPKFGQMWWNVTVYWSIIKAHISKIHKVEL